MGWPTIKKSGSDDEGSQVNFFMNELTSHEDFFSSRNLMIRGKNKLDSDQLVNRVNSEFDKHS